MVAVIVVATVIWRFSGGELEPEPAPPPPPPPVEVEPIVTEPEREPIVLPPLAESDDMVRGMIETLSAHPRLAAALATQGVIDTFVTAVVAIANGESPRGVIDYLEPEEGFAIAEREGRVVIDPASFEALHLEHRGVRRRSTPTGPPRSIVSWNHCSMRPTAISAIRTASFEWRSIRR